MIFLTAVPDQAAVDKYMNYDILILYFPFSRYDLGKDV